MVGPPERGDFEHLDDGKASRTGGNVRFSRLLGYRFFLGLSWKKSK
jgi:hypothetical protein